MPPKAKNMTAAQAMLVNLVNPKLQNFSKPLLLGVTIAFFSVGVLLGVFFLEKAKTRCTPISFPTPAREVQFHLKQVVGGFNYQRQQVDENFRFGGLPCEPDGTMFDAYAQGFGRPKDSVRISCGRGGNLADNGMVDPARPSGIADDTPMFFVEKRTEERPSSAGEDSAEGDIVITTTKRTERLVCLDKVVGFIVADQGLDMATVEQSPDGYPMFQRLAAAGQPKSNAAIHAHPQIGTWACNPPVEFYDLKQLEMGGTTPKHTGVWTEESSHGRLPLCNDPDGTLAKAGGEPFRPLENPSEPWRYECVPIASEGGNELPVLANYRVAEVTTYRVEWTPRESCTDNDLGTALGVAFGYANYIEMFVTALVIGALLMCGMIKTNTGSMDWTATITGETSAQSVAEKLEELAERVVRLEGKPPQQHQPSSA